MFSRDEIRIFRRHEIAEAAADELDAIDADEARELLVRVQDDFAMHEHRLVDAIRELAEQLRARVAAPRARRRGARA